MTLTDQFTKTAQFDVPETYKGYTISYMGDKVGIRFDYTKPCHSVSAQHEKLKTTIINIEVTGETYSLDSLARKIEEMESSKSSSAQDVLALHQGLTALEKFIEENGSDNPFECDLGGAEWVSLHP